MKLSRRVALGVSLAAMVLTGASAAFAEENDMLLFKVVSQKDEVIIGLTEGQLNAAGGLNAGVVGKMLVANGQLAAWQYVVSRNDAGELVEAPTNLNSISSSDALLIEPSQPETPQTLPITEEFK